jgi:hypothetical protein
MRLRVMFLNENNQLTAHAIFGLCRKVKSLETLQLHGFKFEKMSDIKHSPIDSLQTLSLRNGIVDMEIDLVRFVSVFQNIKNLDISHCFEGKE